jgi:cell division protein FtsL
MAEKKNTGKKHLTGVSSFLRGTILTDERITRQFPFVIFLVIMGLLMITNRYRSEKVIREIEVLQDTIDDLRSQSITNSARLMHMSKPSEVVQKVKSAGLGLEEQVRAPGKLVVDKMKKKKK